MYRWQQQNGGRLLTDVPRLPELTWTQFTVLVMEQALSDGHRIHFDLTHVEELDDVLACRGPWADKTSAFELRYLMAEWDRFHAHVTFYRLDKEVAPPWPSTFSS